jgi:RNA polymerase sigma-70 factor (ECF subfamily)
MNSGGGSDPHGDLEREFEAHLPALSRRSFRIAFRVLRQREDAEDVVQHASSLAYLRFHQLRDRERFGAWFAQITFRLALNSRRTLQRRLLRERPPVDPPREQSVLDVVVERERAEQLWSAVEMLPEKLQAVIVLCYVEGHTVSEVAALLQVPPSTVKTRLGSARQRLKTLVLARACDAC